MTLKVINKRTIVIDGRKLSPKEVRELANKHFYGTASGMIRDYGPRKGESGTFLAGNLLNYYNVKSVQDGIIVVSPDELDRRDTRAAAKQFLDELNTKKDGVVEDEEERVFGLSRQDINTLVAFMKNRFDRHVKNNWVTPEELQTRRTLGRHIHEIAFNTLEAIKKSTTDHHMIPVLRKMSGDQLWELVRELQDSFFKKHGAEIFPQTTKVTEGFNSVSLTKAQKNNLVDYMNDLLNPESLEYDTGLSGVVDAAYKALEDVAGRETTYNEALVRELISLYKQKYKK